MHYLSSLYFDSQPLHVLGIFIVHHQQVFTVSVQKVVRVIPLSTGLLVSVPKTAWSNPAEAVGFFGRKNPQRAFLRRGSKAVCPMSQIFGM
jgi:hypothetical protein